MPADQRPNVVEIHTHSRVTRELLGPKGTVIAEDTRAFHKGKQPMRGCRFVLELCFVNVVVGSGIPEPERL